MLSPEKEWSAYTAAVKTAGKKLAASGPGDMKDVMKSYILFLEDPESAKEAHRLIFEEGASAAEAAERTGRYGAGMLALLSDDYLKSRADDVTAAFDYLVRELSGEPVLDANLAVIRASGYETMVIAILLD